MDLRKTTYDDETHGHPHCPSPAKIFPDDEIQDTSREASQVVNTDDDAQKAVIGVAHHVQKVGVADNAAKDPLIIACPSTSSR